MTAAPYEFVDHTGDIRFVARGRTMAELFENSAKALYSSIAAPEGVHAVEERTIESRADDREMLLVYWLSGCQKAFDLERLLLCEFRVVELTDTHVKGIARGEPFDPARHEFRSEIKAVTFHDLYVKETPDGWEAAVVCDV